MQVTEPSDLSGKDPIPPSRHANETLAERTRPRQPTMMQLPRVAATAALLALAATTPALAFVPRTPPPRALRQRQARLAMSSVPTSEATMAESAAPAPAQYGEEGAPDTKCHRTPPQNNPNAPQCPPMPQPPLPSRTPLHAPQTLRPVVESSDGWQAEDGTWYDALGPRNGELQPAARCTPWTCF